MRLSLKLGKLFGIGIYVHWSFFLLPLFVLFANRGNAQFHIGFNLSLLAGVFGCVILHELGHALMARRFGIGTRDITLYPIGGVAKLEKMSEKPWEELWIAVAGPAVNVVIASALIFGLTVAAAIWSPSLAWGSVVGQWFVVLMALNIVLVVFNMLPAFPMDGGRVFRAVLSMWMDRLQATRIATNVGMVVILIFGLGVVTLTLLLGSPNFFILFVMMFVIFMGRMEVRYLEWKRRMELEDLPMVMPADSPY
ncbi:MAG: site-2 protease family protein, partial [Mariprofundaceae bacterium]|nr:site-2 protease family protein [Mariprofundaceae bacterium]